MPALVCVSCVLHNLCELHGNDFDNDWPCEDKALVDAANATSTADVSATADSRDRAAMRGGGIECVTLEHFMAMLRPPNGVSLQSGTTTNARASTTNTYTMTSGGPSWNNA